MVKPVARRQAAGHLRAHYRISERRASRVLHIDRSTLRYRPRPRNDVEIRCRLLELSAEYPRYGYQLLTDKLRLEGHVVNRKRVYRIYSEEGLQLPRRRRKRIRSMARVPLARAKQPNQRWSMDFLHDMLADGRKIRILAIIDEFTRECLALEVAPSIPGQRVTRVLDQIVAHRGRPEYLVSDNGPEFTGRALDQWASKHRVSLHFIQPGKPTQNAFVESFNSTFRRECLNSQWFMHLPHARAETEIWRNQYNQQRPHKNIGRIPPAVFAARSSRTSSPTAPPSATSPTENQVESVQVKLVG